VLNEAHQAMFEAVPRGSAAPVAQTPARSRAMYAPQKTPTTAQLLSKVRFSGKNVHRLHFINLQHQPFPRKQIIQGESYRLRMKRKAGILAGQKR
jgi:hypothetical protein